MWYSLVMMLITAFTTSKELDAKSLSISNSAFFSSFFSNLVLLGFFFFTYLHFSSNIMEKILHRAQSKTAQSSSQLSDREAPAHKHNQALMNKPSRNVGDIESRVCHVTFPRVFVQRYMGVGYSLSSYYLLLPTSCQIYQLILRLPLLKSFFCSLWMLAGVNNSEKLTFFHLVIPFAQLMNR